MRRRKKWSGSKEALLSKAGVSKKGTQGPATRSRSNVGQGREVAAGPERGTRQCPQEGEDDSRSSSDCMIVDASEFAKIKASKACAGKDEVRTEAALLSDHQGVNGEQEQEIQSSGVKPHETFGGNAARKVINSNNQRTIKLKSKLRGERGSESLKQPNQTAGLEAEDLTDTLRTNVVTNQEGHARKSKDLAKDPKASLAETIYPNSIQPSKSHVLNDDWPAAVRNIRASRPSNSTVQGIALRSGKQVPRAAGGEGIQREPLTSSEELIHQNVKNIKKSAHEDGQNGKVDSGNAALGGSVREGAAAERVSAHRGHDDGVQEADSGKEPAKVFISKAARLVADPDFAKAEKRKRKPVPCTPIPADVPSLKSGFLVTRDITEGWEHIAISCVHEEEAIDVECLPQGFKYRLQSRKLNGAKVDCFTDRFREEFCDCEGDCLLGYLPCACSSSSSQNFAYGRDGRLIKRLAKLSEASTHKTGSEYITECSVSCSCSRMCGNRVAQNGLKFKLQVFMTKEKGWGVRALESIPARSFLCECIGEITTNNEQERWKMGNHVFQLRLNADGRIDKMFLKSGLKDDDLLLLDANSYGNVSRFMNHRCEDANVFYRPLQIDTGDTRNYHVAFFAAKDIEKWEELTWDYGENFEQEEGRSNETLFNCRCGSKFCRDKRNSRPSPTLNRSRKRKVSSGK